jgi:hypothetical protein
MENCCNGRPDRLAEQVLGRPSAAIALMSSSFRGIARERRPLFSEVYP